MGGFADAMTRFLMMGLAAMATLAIIGSFTTMTSPSGSSPIWERMSQATQTSTINGSDAAVSDASAGNGTEAGNVTGASSTTIVAPEPTPAERSAKWLEVIAYAVIAIAALLAVIALILMRSSAYWRMAAER